MELFVLVAITLPVMFLTAYVYAYVLRHFYKKEINYKDLVAEHGYRIGFIVMIVVIILSIYLF